MKPGLVPFHSLQGPWSRWIALLILTFPVLLLVVNSASAILLLLALSGLYLGWRQPNPDPLSKDEKLLLFSVVLFVAVAAFSFVHGEWNYEGWQTFWRTFRFLLLIPIYLAVRRLENAEGVWWSGLSLGAILAGGWALNLLLQINSRLPGLGEVLDDPGLFSAISLAMGFMALGGISYFWRRSPWQAILPAAGFLLGITASLLSGSRGVWLVLPVFLILVLAMVARTWNRRQRGALVLGVLALLCVAYFWPLTGVAARLDALWQDTVVMLDGNATGGVLLRLRLWSAAWDTFLQQPLLGAGLGGFGIEITNRVISDELPSTYLNYTHPYNEYLAVMATRGLLGLVSLLLLFGIPLKHFFWAARHRDATLRQLAYGGIVLIVGFAIYACTDSIFDRTTPIVFYVFSLAVTYGLLRARERAYLRAPVTRQQTLSVIVIAKNEADRIASTLSSVYGWADEIIVLDSGSTDATVEICRQFTDKVFITDWPGFGKQKQRALDMASCDWVLSIDADEIVSPELRAEIDIELQVEPVHTGYDVHRPVIIFGRILDFSGSGQSPLRLFKRAAGSFTQVPVHEKIVLSEGTLGRMRGSLYHETYRDYGHAVDKFAQYAVLQAGERFRKGRRATLVGAALRGFLNFIHNYIVRFGFLDGGRGFVMATLHANYTFNKYVTVWMLGLNKKEQQHRE